MEFVACDNPHANRLTIHILAAVADDEARQFSDRTKAALAAYKARGGLLGSHHPSHVALSGEASETGRKAALVVIKSQTMEAYQDLLPVIREWRSFDLSIHLACIIICLRRF